LNKIIAVIGMCGSGKSEAVKFFTEKGYRKVYFGEVVINELKERNLEINEKNERLVREDLRNRYGMAAMAVKSLEKIREYFNNGNVVIESLYSWSEYKTVHNEFGGNFKLLAVHTEKKLRYERLMKREIRPLSEDEAVSRDISEIENIEKGGPIAFADYMILNNGSLEELKSKLEELF